MAKKKVYTMLEIVGSRSKLTDKYFTPVITDPKLNINKIPVIKFSIAYLAGEDGVDFYFKSDKDLYIKDQFDWFPNDFKLKEATKKDIAKVEKILDQSKLLTMGARLNKTAKKVGSDPEIFVVDGKDKLLPAFTFLKGKNDVDVDRTHGYGRNLEANKIYWDGFQAEYETCPDTCLAYHVDSIRLGLESVLKLARKKDPNAKLSIQTVFNVPYEVLEATDDKFVQLGCMPSKNVYGDKGEDITDGKSLGIRSAGGHIHFSIEGEWDVGSSKKRIPEYVKALDAIMGVACVSMFKNYDNPARRRYYGRAGEYRTPPHGLEYRVLSNAWLIHPFITNLVFDMSRMVISVVDNDMMKHWKAKEKDIIDCINNCDVKKAQKILKDNKQMFLGIMKACYKYLNEEHYEKLFSIFMNGMDTVLKNPHDIEANWNLNKEWVTHGGTTNKNVSTSINTLQANKKVS